MTNNFLGIDFPLQRVSNAEKEKPEWYANCCDWIIAQGIALRDSESLHRKYEILNGYISDRDYKKILNPYNSTNDKFTRFPATMRNYDIIKGSIRRYVGEYIKNPHTFIVGANNPEVILAKNRKLAEELSKIVEQQIAQKIQQSYQEWVNQGNNPQEFNPQESINIEEFVKEFNENYIDDISAQGQDILNCIKDITEDNLLYATAYFYYVTFGEVYTYTEINKNKLIKRVIQPIDAFPISTDNIFREDDDMFACRRKMTYQQIIDEFKDYLTEKEIQFLNDYYANNRVGEVDNYRIKYDEFVNYFGDSCNKFTESDRELFKNQGVLIRDTNSGLYDVWHVVWRGEVKRAVVTYINEAGLLTQRIENDDYELNKSIGDISIEYFYEPQVYESVRIGTKEAGIYPYKARAIAYNRKGKLPYNGINELIPGFGKFSIVEIMAPYQVFYNIVSYHREMMIARNKVYLLLIPRSLLGSKSEETIYKMLADGTFYIDDTNDDGMLRSQQIRVVNVSIGDYINQLGQLLLEIENAAKNQVDMTSQRYGEIANSAGKAVTEEAVIRGSMGSVIIEFMMDSCRERDYARDMDYSKLAWIDGLDTSFKDENGKLKYLSLDIDKHIYADYVIKAKNSYNEREKLQEIKSFAFSMGQNDNPMMAIAAIEADNIASISKLMKKYQALKEQHDMEIKQMDKEIEQMKQQFELDKIAAKGEEDRKTLELKGIIDSEIELIRSDSNILSYNSEISDNAKNETLERLENKRSEIEREKIRLEREKLEADNMNKAEDRKLKEKDINAKLEIARNNKNKVNNNKK